MPSLTRLIPIIATAATLTVPAIAQADTFTFGSRLDHEPSNSAPGHNCKEDGSDDATPTCTRVAVDESFAVPGGLTAPADGTITSFSVRAGAPGALTLRLAQLQNFGFNQQLDSYAGLGRSAGVGPTVAIAGKGFDDSKDVPTDPIETFSANLRVHKGDYLGFDSTSTSALYCSHGGASQLIFETPLNDTQQQSTKTDGCELMIQATMVTDPPVTITDKPTTANDKPVTKKASSKKATKRTKYHKRARWVRRNGHWVRTHRY